MASLHRKTESQPDVLIRRTLFVAAFVAFWMLGISARLVYLQISKHEKLVARAHKQQQEAIETSPTRGLLLDRQERELARTIDTISVFVAPDEFDKNEDRAIEEIGCTAGILSSVLNLDQRTLVNQILEAKGGGRRFVWIARRIAPNQAQMLEKMDLAGFHTRKEPKRFYPNGSLAANVLGYVGLDGNGLGGIEQVYNQKITGEPGKLLIEKKLAKPDDHIDCQMGSITVAKRLIHDHHPFGSLTIADALAKSSNVAAIKLGLRVGDPTMYEYITRFGFGSRTGIELPGETAGLVRPLNRWLPSSIGSVAIGQEVGVTPLQMVAAFGVLANDGLRVAPHLIREIRNASGVVAYHPTPEESLVISKETASTLRGMLEGVTLKGTAKKAQLDGYTEAEKTGTAQKIDAKTKTYSKTKFVASFVGFAPVNNPAVVIIIVIDEPGGSYHGGDVAAPVFRQIAEQILPGMGVIPDTDFKNAELVAGAIQTPREISKLRAAEKRRIEETRQEESRASTMPRVTPRDNKGGEIVYAVATSNAIVMPDLRGRSVRDVARACAQLGMQVEAHGDGGRVVGQAPQPGEELRGGQIIYVDFGRFN